VNAVRRRPGGFTLIEVLVALAIVAIGMAALMTALTTSAGTTVYMRDKAIADWVALNQIETVRLALQRPQKGETDGDAEMAGRKWKWHQEIQETEVKGILRIDVSVKPAEVSGDTNWYTTISGISGDALAIPRGDIDYYGRPPDPAGGGGGRGRGGNPRDLDGNPTPTPNNPDANDTGDGGGSAAPPTPNPGFGTPR
jgi:general secretion pathway protein I